MARLHPSFVLGYHGCDESVARDILFGSQDFRESNEAFDWLGPGIYFWESDPRRAYEWACWKVKQGRYKKPFVIGAIIDLGNCLDLTQRENLELLSVSYSSFKDIQIASNLEMPANKDLRNDANQDKLLRFLDCSVIRHLHSINESEENGDLQRFDTVRGLFVEGEPAYPGGQFFNKTHTQVAVRSIYCIKGCFRPLEYAFSDPHMGEIERDIVISSNSSLDAADWGAWQGAPATSD